MMFSEEKMKNLEQTFTRIFSLPITRSTFRELQNATINFTEGDTDSSNALFESLLKDETKKNNGKNLQSFLDKFSVLTRVARDVLERGEFINLATSDIISQPNRVVFLNRFRRVDGEELQFLTDPEGTLRLIQHFVGRLQEAQRNPVGKQMLDNLKNDLNALKDSLDSLRGSR